MSHYETYDAVIIGAGVVGCAIARELSTRHPKKKFAVIERMMGSGQMTSSRNSGVLHSAFHQNPEFLKSVLAAEGSRLAAKYHEERSLPILRCGMLIAVSAEALKQGLWREGKTLYELVSRGRKQNVEFKFLTSRGVAKLEPNIKAAAGIFIPSVCVVDPLVFTNSLCFDARMRGAKFYFGREVKSIGVGRESYDILTARADGIPEKFSSRVLINSAGLYSGDIAWLAGINDYRIYPWRGEYYEVVGAKSGPVKRLIYPALPSGSPSKGIHIGPRVDGRLFIGPNAKPISDKDDYERDKTPPEEFLAAARQFLPSLKESDLRWAYSGIRPKLSPDAREDDFVIRLDRESPPLLDLVGIESPGLAAAMGIGVYVADWVEMFLS